MKLFACLFLSFIPLFLHAQKEPRLYCAVDSVKMNHWADSVFDALSYDERIGQLFLLVGKPESEARNLKRLNFYLDSLHVGGFLFSKGSPRPQAELTNRLQRKSKVPLFIALDGEWGLSMRLTGTTRFPRNMMLGAIADDSLITAYGKEVGRQCREMGIQINFAPSLDVNSNYANPVIGTRSFGQDPKMVAERGLAYARGLESENVFSVAKHFPGHGDTSSDSHYTLPVVPHKRARLDSVELFPFRRYIDAGFVGIMTGHLYVPALDKRPGYPASLSKPIVTDLLKDSFGFKGLVFTDALAMRGALPKRKDRKIADNPSVRAFLAGNDILLSPAAPINDFKIFKEAIASGLIDIEDVEARCLKILRYKYIAGLNAWHPIRLAGLYERINTPHAAWLADKLNAEGMTLLKNDSLLPLKGLDKQRIAVLSLGEPASNDFQRTLARYAKVDAFSLGRRATPAERQAVFKKLAAYDLVICGVFTVRIPESEQLKLLAAKKNLVLAFFTRPYFCDEYKTTVGRAKALVMAYENSPLSQQYAAQLIFGGIAARGKLPVDIPGLFHIGTGLQTPKTRLGYQEPEEVGFNAAKLSRIDSIANQGLRAKAYPGCRVLVAKDGWVVYDKAFGYEDYLKKQEVTPDALYDLASVTKTTATLPALMLLYDRDSFRLGDKLGEHLPYVLGSNKQNLSIEDLLYHQAGLEASLPYALYRRASVKKQAAKGYNMEVARHFFISDSFPGTLRQAICRSPLSVRGRYKYSDLGFLLLADMAEHLAGMPLDSFLRKNFYDRLGAERLCFRPLRRFDTLQIVPTEDDKILRHQVLRGYVHDEAAAFMGGVAGNAGLFGSADDLAKLLQLYLNGGSYGGERFVSDSTMRLFTRSKSLHSRRGLGFDRPATHSHLSPCGALTPASTYGHTGFTGTCFWVDPDNRLIYIFLSNRVNPSRADNKLVRLGIRSRIQDAIYRALGK
ncbi:MAG: serine hydrolase [Tannerella sp.]|jgi:beta-glucosidase-like glycosyl hydrolase/CubicO group peptidase (beta-lactamase class C family)|nr:serine hydrolase [Tannerella sp.]